MHVEMGELVAADDRMTETMRQAHSIIAARGDVSVIGSLGHEDGFVYDGARPWSVSLEQLRPDADIHAHLFKHGGGIGERTFPCTASPEEIADHVLTVLRVVGTQAD